MNSKTSSSNFLKIELDNHKKSILGSQSEFQISFNDLFISELLGDFKVRVKVNNGPVFVNKSGFSTGQSQLSIKIIEESLDEHQKDTFNTLFLGTLPTLEIVVDFNDKVLYTLETRLSIASKLLLKGVFDRNEKENKVNITLNHFKFKKSHYDFFAKKVFISFQHQKKGIQEHKIEVSAIKVPSLHLTSALWKKSLVLSLKANSKVSFENNQLHGQSEVNLIRKSQHELPINKADLEFHFNGISSNALIAFNEINADIKNLQEQAKWALAENGELPEGQDQIWQLYDQIEASSQKKSTLLSKVFDEYQSQNRIQLKMASDSGLSEFNGLIKPYVNQLKVKGNVSLSNDLYTYLAKKFSGIATFKKKQFQLSFEDNKLLMYQ